MPPAAMNFVILTDTHFVRPGARLYGLDPVARLAAAIEVINRDHADIACVVFTGDLAHWGELAAYENLRDTLAALKAPAILMMGNHDRRAPFRSVFPHADDDGAGFVQSLRVLPAASFITLDTSDEDDPHHIGFLCDKRLGFLERALRDAPSDRPLIVFQHHPPFDTGLPHMDRIRLRNPEDEWALFQRIRKPDLLAMGHVHRPISGSWRGIPVHIQRATVHQVAFDLVTENHIPGTHEAPDYSFVRVRGDEIVIHQRSYLYDGPFYSLHDHAAQAAQSPADIGA